MKFELHLKTNIEIKHRYDILELELEDADYKLTENIIEGILEQDGVKTLSRVLSNEELNQLFLNREEDFEEIIRLKYEEQV